MYQFYAQVLYWKQVFAQICYSDKCFIILVFNTGNIRMTNYSIFFFEKHFKLVFGVPFCVCFPTRFLGYLPGRPCPASAH